MPLRYTLEKNDDHSKARAGKINTAHGEILTPVFMPVGTVGSVKAITQQQLLDDIEWQLYTPFTDENKMQEMYQTATNIIHVFDTV